MHCVPLEVTPFILMFCFLNCKTHRLNVFIVCQPFDEDYLNHLDPPVKHMSFHAYLRKLTGGADK